MATTTHTNDLIELRGFVLGVSIPEAVRDRWARALNMAIDSTATVKRKIAIDLDDVEVRVPPVASATEVHTIATRRLGELAAYILEVGRDAGVPITRRAIAHAFGISAPYLGGIMLGRIKGPVGAEYIDAAARFTGIPSAYFVAGDEDAIRMRRDLNATHLARKAAHMLKRHREG